MGEIVAGFSQDYTEEKTEPFSQSEIDARMQTIRVEELSAAMSSTIPLDNLVVPPDKESGSWCDRSPEAVPSAREARTTAEWLALRAEVAEPEQPQHKVLAVTQTSRDIKFSVRIPGERQETSPLGLLWCELYYDPTSDNQILFNRSDVPISLSRVSQDPASSPGLELTVNPNTTKALVPGTWRIKVQDMEVLDFRILEKRPATLALPSGSSSDGSALSDMVNSSGKRSFVADYEGNPYSPGEEASSRQHDRL